MDCSLSVDAEAAGGAYHGDCVRSVSALRLRESTLEVIKASEGTAPDVARLRESLEPRLTPATPGSVMMTHLISDVLTIAALWAMELRRRKYHSSDAARLAAT